MKLTLITPSFNQARFVARTVDSVLSQTGDFELEYLVYDAGSTDGSVEILRGYGDLLRLTVEPDRGQADAIAKGLAAATGEVVGWLNSDDVLYPGCLDRVARAFAERPGLVWLHGRCEIIDEHDRPIRRWLSAYKHYRCQRYSRRSLLLENYISQMTVFWRRAAHERIGSIDSSLRYAMDYDLWLRLAGLGDPLYLEDRLAAFRWYATTKSGSAFRAQFQEDYEVACRYQGRWSLGGLRKRVRTAGILASYRMLNAIPRRRSAGPGNRA